MKKLLAVLLLIPSLSFADYGPYSAELIRVLDGDTAELKISIWPGLTKTIKVRIDGVNAPETRTRLACEKAAGLIAKQFTTGFLISGSIGVHGIRQGKWAGRVLAEISVNGVLLSDALLASGNARKYNGGKREPWCTE